MTRMPRFFASMALLAMASAQATPQLVDGNKRLQLGRYTTADALPQPHLNEPLALVAQLTFPREQVTTVGEAIEYTLLRTGYALVDSQSLTSDARRSNSSNLPPISMLRLFSAGVLAERAVLLLKPGLNW